MADPQIGAVVIDGAGERACCAGGDVILLHDSRKAGDTTRFAMSETGIGYSPDVGGTYFLPRLGSAAGNWLGLTEANLDGSDSAVANVIKDFVQRPPEADTQPSAISCFDEPPVPAILHALDADGSEWAAKQSKSMRRKSPFALSVTLEAMRRGTKLVHDELLPCARTC